MTALDSAAPTTGLEVDEDRAMLAREGVALNGFAAQITVLDGDLSALPPACVGAYDVVLTNPPFAAEGTASPDAGRATACRGSSAAAAASSRGACRMAAAPYPSEASSSCRMTARAPTAAASRARWACGWDGSRGT